MGEFYVTLEAYIVSISHTVLFRCPKEDDRQQSPAPNGLPQHVSISSGDGVRSVRERVVRGRGNSGGFERGMTDLRSKINNRRVHEDHGATSSRHDRSDGGGVRSRKRGLHALLLCSTVTVILVSLVYFKWRS